jgi:Kef-type K+ transport system membrane component KefB
MTDYLILRTLGPILFTAAIAVLLLRLVRVPTIVAYMAAGLVLGPLTGVLEATESLEVIAEAGIALLLFLVGLELSLDHIRGVGRVVVIAGTLQIIGTTVIAWGLATLLGVPATEAVVIGLGATFSSTVVVVKLLDQRRQMTSLHGRIAVGILLVQDAAVILTLTLFAGLGESDLTSVAASLVKAFAGLLALAALSALAAKFVLPRLFGWAERSSETLFVWSLAWCFVFILAAEALHLSVELGAFIAGVGLAQLHFSQAVQRRVQPIVNFFLAIFFVALGLRMEPAAALRAWPLLLALIAIVMVIKPLILLAVIPRFGYGPRTSFKVSITLAQMSEFSFILASLAAAAGMISDANLSVIALAGFITIGSASLMILNDDALYERVRGTWLMRLFRAAGPEDQDEAPPLSNHIIVVGMNSLGTRLVRELTQRGETVLAMDTDAQKLQGVATHTMLGTVDDIVVLESANYSAAKLVVSALQIEDSNAVLTYRCRQAGVPIAVHAFEASLVDELRDIGATHLIMSKHDGTREIALRLRNAGVLG